MTPNRYFSSIRNENLFNFQGEFDFDESLPRDQLEIDLQAMFDLEIDEDDLV